MATLAANAQQTVTIRGIPTNTAATVGSLTNTVSVSRESVPALAQIHAPSMVAGAKVTAEVLGHGRHDKIRIVKMRRRKHYRKQQGHRQWYTELKITAISA